MRIFLWLRTVNNLTFLFEVYPKFIVENAGVLYMVDLASSEHREESGVTGDRLAETKHIKKSLSNLGNVIMALAAKESHIPSLVWVFPKFVGPYAKMQTLNPSNVNWIISEISLKTCCWVALGPNARSKSNFVCPFPLAGEFIGLSFKVMSAFSLCTSRESSFRTFKCAIFPPGILSEEIMGRILKTRGCCPPVLDFCRTGNAYEYLPS